MVPWIGKYPKLTKIYWWYNEDRDFKVQSEEKFKDERSGVTLWKWSRIGRYFKQVLGSSGLNRWGVSPAIKFTPKVNTKIIKMHVLSGYLLKLGFDLIKAKFEWKCLSWQVVQLWYWTQKSKSNPIDNNFSKSKFSNKHIFGIFLVVG
jgi:hypothetical protein